MPIRTAALIAGIAGLVYLSGRMLMPFLPALCWAFALAVIAYPVHRWLAARTGLRNLAAAGTAILAALVVIAPAAFVVHALYREATDLVRRFAGEAEAASLRAAIEASPGLGLLFHWLDSRVDIPKEAIEVARSAAGWASSAASSVVAGSVRLLGQIAVTIFVLFYFLRDGEMLVEKLRALLALPASVSQVFAGRIVQTIRVSLGGKAVVSTLQGLLGGLMFWWLGIPAPVFWGVVMAVLSLFPVIGSFVVWLPVSVTLALQGDWRHALMLAGWGVLIIHPVDNLLGPVLVGKTLGVHTLAMFFSIIGGLAAFGAAGIVLGPLTVAIVAGFADLQADKPVG